MGFSVLLDIAGSMIIGAIVLVMIARVNNNIAQSYVNNGSDMRIQSTLTNGVQAMQSDIRKIGCNSSYVNAYSGPIVLLADTSSIKFLADMSKTGTMDTVYYYLGPTTDLLSTQNPNDRYIYRKINSLPPFKAVESVITFKLQYYNNRDSAFAVPVTALYRDSIRSIGFTISVAPTDSIKGLPPGQDRFPSISWQAKTMARNLYKQDPN